jgi:hypothetical protein
LHAELVQQHTRVRLALIIDTCDHKRISSRTHKLPFEIAPAASSNPSVNLT